MAPFLAPLEYDSGEFLLRAFRPGDGMALQAAVLASYDHLSPWMPWAKRQYPLAEAESTARRLSSHYLANEDFALSIWKAGELVGGTGFHLRGRGLDSKYAEIGMWIHVQHSGRGLGTRVLTAMLEWGFGDWGWERLEWRCDPRNIASAKVAEKCGLRLEGTLRENMRDAAGHRRDSLVYAILEEEWAGRRA